MTNTTFWEPKNIGIKPTTQKRGINHCELSSICDLWTPQNDLGNNLFLTAVNSQPMCKSQTLQFATIHAYLEKLFIRTQTLVV
jgi:hypothetical protein